MNININYERNRQKNLTQKGHANIISLQVVVLRKMHYPKKLIKKSVIFPVVSGQMHYAQD